MAELIRAGLTFELELGGINQFISGFQEADQAMEAAAESGDKVGKIFVNLSGEMSGIPVILERITEEAMGGLGLNNVSDRIAQVVAAVERLTNTTDLLLSELRLISSKPFKVQLELPNIQAFKDALEGANLFSVLNQNFTATAQLLDSTGLASKLQALSTAIQTASVGNILAKSLEQIAKALERFTKLQDFNKLSPRISSFVDNIAKLSNVTSNASIVSIENLAKVIPKLVTAFRQLATSKNLDAALQSLKKFLPVFEALNKISVDSFVNAAPQLSGALDTLFKTLKEFSKGTAIEKLPTLLQAIGKQLPLITSAFTNLPTEQVTNFVTGIDAISKSFRNFGLAVKNFGEKEDVLTKMSTQIIEFARALQSGLNLDNFVPAITAVADALAKLGRAISSFTRNKNVADIPQRFRDIRDGLVGLNAINLDQVAKNLTKITGPLKDLTIVLRTIASAKELDKFGAQLRLLNLGLGGSTGPLDTFKKILASMAPIFTPVINGLKAMATELLKLPLKFVIANFNIFKAVFITLPFNAVAGTLRLIVGVFEGFVTVIRAAAQAIGFLISPILKLITLGGSLTQVFSFFGGGKTNQQLNQINQTLKQTQTSLQGTSNEADEAANRFQQFDAQANRVRNTLNPVTSTLKTVASGLTLAGIGAAALNAGKIVLFGNSILSLTKRILALGVAIKTLQVAGNLLGNLFNTLRFTIGSAISTAIQATIQFEQLQLSIQSLTAAELVKGGEFGTIQEALPAATEAAKGLIASLQQLAIQSPFSIQDIQSGFVLAQSFGFAGDEALELTRRIVDFVTATGQSGQAIEQIARVAGQIATTGKLKLDDVNQLTTAGINLRQTLADLTTEGNVAKLLENITAGAVSSADALKALDIILLQQEGAAARAGESLGGLINSLLDLKDAVLRQAFAGLFEALKPFAAQFATILQGDEIKEQLVAVSNTIRDAVLGIIDAISGPLGFIISAFQSIPDPVKKVGAEILKFLAIMGGATIVFTTLNAALLVIGTAFALFVNPIGLAAGALVGIIALIQSNQEIFEQFATTILNVVTPAFTFLQTKLEEFGITAAGVAVKFADFIGAIITNIGSINFGGIFDKFQPVVTKFIDAFGNLVTAVGNGFGSILDIAGNATSDLVDFFSTSISDLSEWGSNIVTSFADGILNTLSIVADALNELGSVIAFWLSPGSPPRIVPDIDKWGESTAQEFLDGFGEADFNVIDDFASTFEKLLETVNVDTSNIDLTSVATDFASALKGLKDTGKIDTSFITDITDETGLASEEVIKLVESYAGVEIATQKAANATSAYEKAVAGLSDELQGIEAAEQFENENKKLTQLRQNLESRNLSESQRAAAVREIEKIQATQRLRQLKQQKEAADTNLDAQKEQLATEKARIDLANKFQQKEDQTDVGGAKGIKDRTDALKKEKDETEKIADAQFRYKLAIADTAGKIALYKEKLAGLEKGSAEYFDTLTKIAELEEQLNNERERAAKKKKGEGGPISLLDDLQVGPTGKLAQVTEQLNAPLEKFKTTMDEAKKKYEEFVDNIKQRFGAIKKTFEDLGLTAERLRNIAIGLGVAFAAISIGPTVITVLGALATFVSPLLAVGAAVAGIALAFKFFNNGFNIDKTLEDLKALRDAILNFAGIGTNIIKGFLSRESLVDAVLGIETASLSDFARSLGALAGGVVQLFIDFQKNILESIGRIALGANPIDAILTSFLNVDYTGTGEKIKQAFLTFFSNIVTFIQNIPTIFQSNLANTDGGFAGIIKAAIQTALQLLSSNPFIDAIKSLLNFDLSNIKINIGGIEFSGGAELGKKLATLLNSLFNTDNFNFLGSIDFSTPLTIFTSIFEQIQQQVIGIVNSIRTTLSNIIPPEVMLTLDLIGKAFGVLGLAVEEFKKNFITEETSAALSRLGQAALFAGSQFLKLTGFVIGGLAAIASLLGVGILPEIPRIITNIANALTGLFNFIGTSIQKVIDFVLKGDFTLAAFVNLAIDLFGDLRSTFDTITTAFGNLSGLIGDAIRNVIQFAGIKFGFDGEAIIKQFEGIINIVSKVGDILLLVFGGILVKSLFSAAKNISLLRFAFTPVLKVIQLLISPLTLLITIIKRLFISYKTLGTGIKLIQREHGGFLKSTKSIQQLIGTLIGILFKGRQGFGELAKPVAATGEAIAEVATKGGGILKFFGSILGFLGKMVKPLLLVSTLFGGLGLLINSGALSGLGDLFTNLTGIDLSFIEKLIPKEGISTQLLLIFGDAIALAGPKIGALFVNMFKNFNVATITTVLKNTFSKIDLSTVFTVFTTFPGLLKKFFSPTVFSGLVTLFQNTFGKISLIITPLINIVTKFGGLFAGLLPLITNPITLIIGAVTFLGLAWYNNWFNIREVTANVIQWLTDNIPGLAQTAIQWIIDAVQMIPVHIGGFVLAIMNGLAPIANAILETGSEWVTAALQWLTDAVTQAPTRIQEFTASLVKNLILGALGLAVFGATMLFNLFQWIPEAVAAIPTQLQAIWTGFSNWFTNTLIPLFTGKGPEVGTSFITALSNFVLTAFSIISPIGGAIIRGILSGVQLAMADPRVSGALQPLIDKFNNFINGPNGILTVAANVFNGFTKLASDIGTVVFTNPFEQISAFINGEQGILTTVNNVFTGFTDLVTNLTGIVLPNPFQVLIDVINGDSGIINAILELGSQMTTFVTTLTGIIFPNPFEILQAVFAGEGSITDAVAAFGLQIEAFAASLDAILIPNVLLPIQLGIEALKTLFPQFKTEFTAVQTFINGLTFTNIFQTLMDAMSSVTTLVQPIIDKFGELKEFFATFEFPNPFASLADFEIPAPVKAALKLAGIDVGEETGAELAKATTDTAASELTNASIAITLSNATLESGKTEGTTLGKNIIDGVVQGAQDAADEPGQFDNIQRDIQNTWNAIWGSNSPSTVADETMGVPIGQGIMQGITTSFEAAAPIFTTSFTAFYDNLIKITEKFHKDVLKAFEEFFDTVLDMLDTFIADVIKKITEMVNRFLVQIRRLARDTIAILTQFLSDVRSKMDQFADIMEDAAQKGVDAFVTYIEEHFVERVGAALEGAFGALAANEDLQTVVHDGGVVLGEGFVDGIIEGISNQEGPLFTAIRQLVQDMISTAQTEAGIASPSKETAERIGKPFGSGILDGFLSTKNNLINGVNGVIGTMLSGSYADKISNFANTQITDPFNNAMQNLMNTDIAQNVNLRYNGMINSLPNLLQNAAIATNNSLDSYGRMSRMQNAVISNKSFSPNQYVSSHNERHYHMHLTTTPERATQVRRNFRVAEHLGLS